MQLSGSSMTQSPSTKTVGFNQSAGAGLADPAEEYLSLVAQVERHVREGKVELPMLPEAAIKVREIVAVEGPIKDIAAVLQRDPALAASVLRYANSVAFAGLKEIVDLSQAVARLGLNAVEQTVLAISAKSAFRANDADDEKLFRALWEHSITAAVAARRLAARAGDVDREKSFLSGLLHDIGKVVLLRCATALRKAPGQKHAFTEPVLMQLFDSLHREAGAAFLKSWNIPEPIQAVVARHHDVEFDGGDSRLIAVVAFSDAVAWKLGATLNPEREMLLEELPAAKYLAIDPASMESLLEEIRDDVATFRAAF